MLRSPPATPFIEIQNLSKHYPPPRGGAALPVLQDIELNIVEGEFLSVIGPSGCGKSTLLHLIAGLTKPTCGQVLHKSAPVTGPGPGRAVMFQEYGLYPWLTVWDNIELGLKAKGIDKQTRKQLVRHFIDLVQLSGFEHHYPSELSGGMKQRVSIARCLSPDPDVVLMDEPFSALDSLTRDFLQEEIQEIHQRTKRTFVLITHNIDEAVFLSDRVAVFSNRPGRIKEILDIDLERPRTISVRSSSPAFLSYRERLLHSLRAESSL